MNVSAVMYLFEKSEEIMRRDVEEVLGGSQTMAGRVLRQVVDKKRIETNGADSSRTYSRKKSYNRRMIREDLQEFV